jgi:hypothetical protein
MPRMWLLNLLALIIFLFDFLRHITAFFKLKKCQYKLIAVNWDEIDLGAFII